MQSWLFRHTVAVVFGSQSCVAGGGGQRLCHGFDASPNRVDAVLRHAFAQGGARADLPAAVMASAARPGALGNVGGFAPFGHTGQMWRKPGFQAGPSPLIKPLQQTRPGFCGAPISGFRCRWSWPTTLQATSAGWGARLLGAVPVMRQMGGPAILQSEAPDRCPCGPRPRGRQRRARFHLLARSAARMVGGGRQRVAATRPSSSGCRAFCCETDLHQEGLGSKRLGCCNSTKAVPAPKGLSDGPT